VINNKNCNNKQICTTPDSSSGPAPQSSRQNTTIGPTFKLHKAGQFGQFKTINNVATRSHFIKLKCTKFDFGWGSAPDPAGGAHSTPSGPAAGPTSKKEEERGRGKNMEGEGGSKRRREREENKLGIRKGGQRRTPPQLKFLATPPDSSMSIDFRSTNVNGVL